MTDSCHWENQSGAKWSLTLCRWRWRGYYFFSFYSDQPPGQSDASDLIDKQWNGHMTSAIRIIMALTEWDTFLSEAPGMWGQGGGGGGQHWGGCWRTTLRWWAGSSVLRSQTTVGAHSANIEISSRREISTPSGKGITLRNGNAQISRCGSISRSCSVSLLSCWDVGICSELLGQHL